MADAGHAEITVQRRIEWFDTDASGFYHNSVAFRLFEVAETVLLERLGILDDVYGRLPRVHLSADFGKLLGFADVVDTTVRVDRVGNSSVEYSFLVERKGDVCVTGRAVAVLLEGPGGTKAPWSEKVRRVLTTAGVQEPQLLS